MSSKITTFELNEDERTIINIALTSLILDMKIDKAECKAAKRLHRRILKGASKTYNASHEVIFTKNGNMSFDI